MFLRIVVAAVVSFIVVVIAAVFLHHTNVEPTFVAGACLGVGMGIGFAIKDT